MLKDMAEGRDSTSIYNHLKESGFYNPNKFDPTSLPTLDLGYLGWLRDLDRVGSRGGG